MQVKTKPNLTLIIIPWVAIYKLPLSMYIMYPAQFIYTCLIYLIYIIPVFGCYFWNANFGNEL